MKVAMVIDFYPPVIGGAEVQLAALTPRLRAAGVDVRVVTRAVPGLPGYEMMNSVPVYRVPAIGTPRLATLCFQVFSLARLVLFKPDIIHAHGNHSPALIGLAAKEFLKNRLVVKLLSSQEISVLRTKLLGGQRWRSILKHTDAFIAISQQIDQNLSKEGVELARRRAIPNGVDLMRFSPVSQHEKIMLRRQLGLPEDRLLAVYSGRLHPVKGADLLLTAWQGWLNPTPGRQLLMVGTGPLESRLRAQAGEDVTFLGKIADVSPYLQASDLFVLPSQWEGLSNALLEAMACGLPILASDHPGNRELIRHGETGLLFRVGDEAHLQLMLKEMMDHLDEHRILGQNARQWVAENFAIEHTVQKLVELYGSLIKKDSGL